MARGAQHLPNLISKGAQRVIEESLFPDQYPGWARAACKAAKALKPVDVVWVTGGPWGMFVVGAKVAKALGVPWSWTIEIPGPWTCRNAKSPSVVDRKAENPNARSFRRLRVYRT